MTRRLLLPREHGAWGMMLQPFVAGALLGRSEWTLVPALLAVLAVFVMREPVLVLARQRFVWREVRPETADARWSLSLEAALLAVCGMLLLWRVPFLPLATLGSLAFSLTALAVWMAIRNRQRSMLLQSMSAFGLSSSAIIAGYAATGAWQHWMLPLCALLGLHSLSGIFAVHTRLDAMAAARNPAKLAVPAAIMRRRTILLQILNLMVAVVLLMSGNPLLAAPVLVSVCGVALELWRVAQPAGLKEPLKRVGWRALSLAVVHTLLLVAVLWRFREIL